MEFTPLICVIQNFNVCQKLKNIFVNTIEDWQKLKQKDSNEVFFILSNQKISEEEQKQIQIEIDLYEASLQINEKAPKFFDINISANNSQMNCILKTGRSHRVFYQDLHSLQGFQYSKKQYYFEKQQLKITEKFTNNFV